MVWGEIVGRAPLRPWLPGFFVSHPEPWAGYNPLPPMPPVWQWQKDVVSVSDLIISRMMLGAIVRPGLRLPPPKE